MAINAGTVFSALELNTGPWSRALKTAGKDLKIFADKSESASKRIDALGGAMKSTGSTITTFVTVPLLGAGAALTKFAGDFEESTNKVASIADTTVMSIEEIQEGVLNLSDEMGIAANELNETLYQTISATGDTANALDYVEIASKAAIGGFTDTTTAVDGLTTVLNAYGLKGKEAMQSVADQMLMAQNYGKTTFGEMASSIGNVIPIAASLDVSTQELFASIATLTKNGIGTSEAITGLKAAYSNILKPTKQAKDLSKELGIEFSAAHLKSVGWAKFLDEIREKTGGNADKMAELFGSTEALNAVTVLATTGAKDFSGALDAMDNSAGATQKAFETMEQGVNDGLGDMLNSLKNLGIELGQVLLPYVMKMIEKVQEWIDWFKGLDDSTKELIVKIGMVVAAIGPVLLILGTLASSIGNIIGLVTTISGAFGIFSASSGMAAAGATLATGATSGLGTALTALTGPIGLTITGIAALTAGGYALYKHLSSESIPEIQRFGSEVSNSTQEAVGGFLDLNDKATVALNSLAWSGQAVTEEMSNNIINNFQSMSDTIVESLNKGKDESLETLNQFFSTADGITQEEKEEMIKSVTEGYEARKKIVENGQNRIIEILETAKKEKRSLTEKEQKEINEIQQKMVDYGIEALSESEVEQRVIMEKIKNQASEITARQAAEVVKNSKEQKEKVIAEAEEQYEKVIAEIIKQRDQMGSITEKQAQKLIEEAEKQKNETIKRAEIMHKKIVEEAKKQAKEHIDKVDWETGEILSKWEVFKNNLSEKWENIKKDASEKLNQMVEDVKAKWDEMKTDISTKLEEIKSNVSTGWDNMKTTAKKKWQEIKTEIINKWTELKNDALTWAENMVTMFSTGIKNKVNDVKYAVNSVAIKIKDYLGFSSPTKEGPASDSDKWAPNFMNMFNQGIIDNTPKVAKSSENVAQKIKDALDKVNSYVENTVSIIEKKFELWKLKNKELEGSTEELSKKLEVQKEKHKALNSEIENTQEALVIATEKYGSSSEVVQELELKLIDLQIAQEKVNNEIKETIEKVNNASSAWEKYYKAVGHGVYDLSTPRGGGGSSRDDDNSEHYYNENTGEHHIFKDGKHTVIDSNGNSRIVVDEDKEEEPGGWIGSGPKWHDGGWVGKPVGLKHDEVPAILQTGEFVLSRKMINGLINTSNNAQTIDYDKLGKALAKYIKPSINMDAVINSPQPLNPSKIKQEQEVLLRQLAMDWGV